MASRARFTLSHMPVTAVVSELRCAISMCRSSGLESSTIGGIPHAAEACARASVDDGPTSLELALGRSLNHAGA
jgi:hypothetical protein